MARTKKDTIKNLKPCRTTAEAKERGRKGGINSGKAKKQKKLLKEITEMLLDKKVPDVVAEKFSAMYPDVDFSELTNRVGIIQRLILNVLIDGDNKSFELLRDQIGEKPKEIVEATNTNINITDEKVINNVIDKIKDL